MTAGLPLFDRYPNVPGTKRRTGQSVVSAERMKARAPTIARRVYDSINNEGDATPDEVAARIGVSILSVRPRCSELTAQGLLIETPQVGKNAISGHKAAKLTIGKAWPC